MTGIDFSKYTSMAKEFGMSIGLGKQSLHCKLQIKLL